MARAGPLILECVLAFLGGMLQEVEADGGIVLFVWDGPVPGPIGYARLFGLPCRTIRAVPTRMEAFVNRAGGQGL